MTTQRLSPLRPTLQVLVRFDRSRITYVTAFQNALGVFIPFAVGAATGHLVAGLAAGIGALNVCFSDRPGPYRLRAGRMLMVAVVGSISALIGALAGPIGWLTVALVGLWSIAGGMLVLYGPAAEQFGLTNVLLLVVYGGFHPPPDQAVAQAACILVGGLFQTGLSVAAWPLRQYGPERSSLAAVFQALAAFTRSPTSSDGAPPATAEMNAARATLVGPGSAHGPEAEAFRVVLDECERIRLELLVLRRLRSQISDIGRQTSLAADVDALWSASGETLDRLAAALAHGDDVAGGAELLRTVESAVGSLDRATPSSGPGAPIMSELVGHAEALLGQLRACIEIVDGRSPEGIERNRRTEGTRPPSMRLREPMAALHANMTLRSASFRHALRLAVTLAVAAALARQFGLSRSYWVPLTAAIVLKPDFTSTFTRGVLRIVGTMLGLGLATLLAHLVLGDVAARVVLIGLFVFVVRSVGPANFGISAVAITALVVLLLSFAGAGPESTIPYRALDTLIGGLLALVAYAVWPTWESARAPSVLADMLDTYRRYVAAVIRAYLDPEALNAPELDRLRLEARLARSNAEASVDRMRAEPAGTPAEENLAEGILASSHRFIRSAMAIEASLYTRTEPFATPALRSFAADVEACLISLSGALRHPTGDWSPGVARGRVDLRADHTALADAAAAAGLSDLPLLLETERMTNSLNTMADLIRRSESLETPAAVTPEAGNRVEHSA